MEGWIDGQRERKKEVRREGRKGREGKAILTLPLIENAGRISLFKKMNLVFDHSSAPFILCTPLLPSETCTYTWMSCLGELTVKLVLPFQGLSKVINFVNMTIKIYVRNRNTDWENDSNLLHESLSSGW